MESNPGGRMDGRQLAIADPHTTLHGNTCANERAGAEGASGGGAQPAQDERASDLHTQSQRASPDPRPRPRLRVCARLWPLLPRVYITDCFACGDGELGLVGSVDCQVPFIYEASGARTGPQATDGRQT
eukprot:766810-Prymnesium_polylepis.1